VAHSKKKRAIDHKGPTINDRVTALPQNRLHKVVRRLHQRARRGATSYLTSASSLFFLSSEVSRFWVAGAGAFVFSRPSRCLTIFVHAPMSGRRERVKRAASNAPLSGTFHQTSQWLRLTPGFSYKNGGRGGRACRVRLARTA